MVQMIYWGKSARPKANKMYRKKRIMYGYGYWSQKHEESVWYLNSKNNAHNRHIGSTSALREK